MTAPDVNHVTALLYEGHCPTGDHGPMISAGPYDDAGHDSIPWCARCEGYWSVDGELGRLRLEYAPATSSGTEPLSVTPRPPAGREWDAVELLRIAQAMLPTRASG